MTHDYLKNWRNFALVRNLNCYSIKFEIKTKCSFLPYCIERVVLQRIRGKIRWNYGSVAPMPHRKAGLGDTKESSMDGCSFSKADTARTSTMYIYVRLFRVQPRSVETKKKRNKRMAS